MALLEPIQEIENTEQMNTTQNGDHILLKPVQSYLRLERVISNNSNNTASFQAITPGMPFDPAADGDSPEAGVIGSQALVIDIFTE